MIRPYERCGIPHSLGMGPRHVVRMIIVDMLIIHLHVYRNQEQRAGEV